MTVPMTRSFLLLACVALAAACHGGRGPEMHVIGGLDSTPHEVVYVQVTNPASHSMRLTKLQYTFAADTGKEVAAGEVDSSREVPAGAAVVVGIPLEPETPNTSGPFTLHGELTAELDQIVRARSGSRRWSHRNLRRLPRRSHATGARVPAMSTTWSDLADAALAGELLARRRARGPARARRRHVALLDAAFTVRRPLGPARVAARAREREARRLPEDCGFCSQSSKHASSRRAARRR